MKVMLVQTKEEILSVVACTYHWGKVTRKREE